MSEVQAYTADQIQFLKGLEGVRKRPGMYIGTTGSGGLHHLVYEIVDNAIDEAIGGYCDTIIVTIHPDNSITVKDNGRGIPTGINKAEGKTGVELVFTELHAGGKFGGGAYKVSGGLHGVGASVVNALSEHLTARISQNGKIYQQKYARGEILTPLEIVGESDETGSEITFLPDNQIFDTTVYEFSILEQRMREMAFLTKGVKIILKDTRPGEEKEKTYHYEGGIKEYITYLNRSKKPSYSEIFYCFGNKDDVEVEVAMQQNESYAEGIYCYVNNIHTPDGGTHLTGFRSALTRIFNDYCRNNKFLKEKDEPLMGEDIRESLTAVVSIKLGDPQFEGQTKQKLGSAVARGAVESVVSEQLTYYLEQNPSVAKQMCDKIIKAQIARIASRNAKDSARRKSSLDSGGLPGKLADCSDKNPQNCEIYIVEGDSAGGSAKNARNKNTQAILPLRGKILNVQKAKEDKILLNNEIKAMITAFGTGVGQNFDISKLRYHKIIIMTDADVDGAHIATLLLTFMYKFMPELIRAGHVYLAQPPLYKLEKNKKVYYAYSDEELNNILLEVGRDQNNKIQRYKGLGEMDADQLWETTMDPQNRILLKVSMENDLDSELDVTFSTLMGDEVEPRREFIEANAKFVKNLDI